MCWTRIYTVLCLVLLDETILRVATVSWKRCDIAWLGREATSSSGLGVCGIDRKSGHECLFDQILIEYDPVFVTTNEGTTAATLSRADRVTKRIGFGSGLGEDDSAPDDRVDCVGRQ